MDAEIEKEAVDFFEELFDVWGTNVAEISKLMKLIWGKKSQVPPHIRKHVGKTIEQFTSFLSRHPERFIVKGNTVQVIENEECVLDDWDDKRKSLKPKAWNPGKKEPDVGQYAKEAYKKLGLKQVAVPSLASKNADAAGTTDGELVTFLEKHPKGFTINRGIDALIEKPNLHKNDLVATDFVKKRLRTFFGRCRVRHLYKDVVSYNINKASKSVPIFTGNTELEFTEFIKKHPKHFIIDCDSEVCLTEEIDSFHIKLRCQLGIVNNIIEAGGFLTYQRKSCVFFPKSALVEFDVDNVRLNDLLVLGQKMYFDAKTNADSKFKASYKATRVWNAEADAEIPSPVLNLDEVEKRAHNLVGSQVQKRIQLLGPQQITMLYRLFKHENVKDTIGSMPHDIINFITSYPKIFRLSKGLVSLINAKHSKPTIINRGGEISRIFPTSGFICFNTSRAVSSVFFHISNVIDNKYNRPNLSDLVKVGDSVRFDAVPGKRGGGAEWAATRVWREGFVPPRVSLEPLAVEQRQQQASNANAGVDNPLDWEDLEEVLERELGSEDDSDDSTSNTSSKDSVDLLSVKDQEIEDCQSQMSAHYGGSDLGDRMLSDQDIVVETGSSVSSTSSDTSFSESGRSAVVQPKLPPHTLSNGQILGQPTSPVAPAPIKLLVEVACQTAITGDIIHTKLYNAENEQVISMK